MLNIGGILFSSVIFLLYLMSTGIVHVSSLNVNLMLGKVVLQKPGTEESILLFNVAIRGEGNIYIYENVNLLRFIFVWQIQSKY